MHNQKAQISIFLIAIAIISLIGFLIIYNSSKKNELVLDIASPADIKNIRMFGEICLKDSAEKYIKIAGRNGGYIKPEGGGFDEIVPQESLPLAEFEGWKVPVFLDGQKMYIPDLDIIRFNLMSYIPVGLKECFATGKFDSIGISFKSNDVPVLSVDPNAEDTTITLFFPVKIRIRNAERKVEVISATLPVRLQRLYYNAAKLVQNAASVQPDAYNLGADCASYGGFIVQIKEISEDLKVAQIIDPNPGNHLFQFGIRNANIAGNCNS